MSRLSQYTKHQISRLLHSYADWRIGVTYAEKHCYKNSDSILLTFDDYGTTEEVEDILMILAEQQLKAMFFLQGDWAAAHPELVDQIQLNGHLIGNHTMTHSVLVGLPDASIKKEISGGLPGPWLRPPQGRYNNHVRSLAAKLGYRICYWTIDSNDWSGASLSDMRYTILSELQPGAVILFHLHGTHTRELLPGLISDIRERGYQLTPMTESWSAAAFPHQI